MKTVYLAGPYTRGDPVVNVSNAIDLAEKVRKWGFTPFIPHLTMFWQFLYPHEVDFWYKYDLEWLSKCDILLRFGTESPGADKEIEFAREHGIKIYFSTAEMLIREKDWGEHA